MSDHPLPRGYSREICKSCWNINALGFHVPDDIWNAAVPELLRDRILCIVCFARFADERLIAWEKVIEFFPVSMASHLELDSVCV